MADRYSYRDLSHPSYQDHIKGHNTNTLKLVKTIAEFAQKISVVHEQFASQVHGVVEAFRKKNQELKKDRGPIETDLERNDMRRPVEYVNTLYAAWETLLHETQYDAQSHADTADLLLKNVHGPLLEIASYKRSQSKKLYSFRDNFESILSNSDESVHKCKRAYIEAYQTYRSNINTRESLKYLAAYHNAHNEYVLTIRASNRYHQEYHRAALPYLLEELEEIHIDLANTLNGAIESHALLLLSKANEQTKQFDSILQTCKDVNPINDVHNFLLSLNVEEADPFSPKHHSFVPPSDPTIPGSELATLKNTIACDRYTEMNLKAKQMELQKEAAELTSYLKQNQDVTQTLMNVCQRNIANHQYAKVYETQEDLCRKRNEIRRAHLQLAAIKAQIELLTQKQNGSALEADSKESVNKAANKSSIRGMWKKAFKSLKSKDKDKDKGDKDSEKGSDKDADKKYSRMSSRGNIFTPNAAVGENKTEYKSEMKQPSSRQSSLKRSLLKRNDSKGEPPEEKAEADDRQAEEIDPVYSLLKCAADLPRQSKLQGHGHACCMQRAGDNLTVRSNSRSSSPSSAGKKLGDVKLLGCIPWYKRGDSGEGMPHDGRAHPFPLDTKSTDDIARSSRSLGSNGSTPDISKDRSAKTRRVKFQMESRKSQSLETPYHHTHHQQRLAAELLDRHERSKSYTSISTYARQPLADPRAPSLQSLPRTCAPAKITPQLPPPPCPDVCDKSLQASSKSEEQCPPSDSFKSSQSHEMKTREGSQEMHTREIGVGPDIIFQQASVTDDVSCTKSRRKEAFRHQRSYSCGDLTPSGDEKSDDTAIDSATQILRDAQASRLKGLKDKGGRRSGEENMQKSSTERRKGWIKQKQKSKSFDFTWRSGMWSPVEGRKHFIVVPEKKKQPQTVKLKPPSMFEIDSGSSYESNDLTIFKPKKKPLGPGVARREEHVGKGGKHGRDSELDTRADQEVEQLTKGRDPRLFNSPSVPLTDDACRQLHEKRRTMMVQNKSHSFDSSLEEAKEEGETVGSPIKVKSEFPREPQKPGLSVRDKRLRLLQQRKSRSLDAYDPNEQRARLEQGGPWSKPSPDTLRRRTSTSPHDRRGSSDPTLDTKRRMSSSREGIGSHQSSQGSPGRGSPGQGQQAAATKSRRKAFAEQKSFSYEVTTRHPNAQSRPNTETLEKQEKGRPRSKGRMLPQLPIHEHQLEEHIQKVISGSSQPQPDSHTSLSGADASSKSPKSTDTCQKSSGDKPKSKDRRKLFSEQKSFSYEVNQYFPNFSQRPVDKKSGSEGTIYQPKKLRDYWEETEVTNFQDLQLQDLHRELQSCKPAMKVPYDKSRGGNLSSGKQGPGPYLVNQGTQTEADLERDVTRSLMKESAASSSGDRRKVFAQQKSFSYEVTTRFSKPQLMPSDKLLQCNTGEHRLSPSSPRSPRSPHDTGDKQFYSRHPEKRRSQGSPHSPRSPRSPHDTGDRAFDGEQDHRRMSYTGSPRSPRSPHVQSTEQHFDLPPEHRKYSQSGSPKHDGTHEHRRSSQVTDDRRMSTTKITLDMPPEKRYKTQSTSPRDLSPDHRHVSHPTSPREHGGEHRTRSQSSRERMSIDTAADKRYISLSSSPREGEVPGDGRRYSQSTSPRQRDPPGESRHRAYSGSKGDWVDERGQAISPREDRRMSSATSPRDPDQRRQSQSMSPRGESERRMSQSTGREDRRMSQSTSPREGERRMSQSRDMEGRRMSTSGKEHPEGRRMSQSGRDRDQEGRRMSQSGREERRMSQTGEGSRRMSTSTREERRMSRSDAPKEQRRMSRENLALDMGSEKRRRSSRSGSPRTSRSPHGHDVYPEPQKSQGSSRLSQEMDREDRTRMRRSSGPRSPHTEQLRSSYEKHGERRSSSGSPRSPNEGRVYDSRSEYGRRSSDSPRQSHDRSDRTPERGERRWASSDKHSHSRSPSETRGESKRAGILKDRRKKFGEQKSFSYDCGTSYHPHPAVARVEESERLERPSSGREGSSDRRGPMSLRDKRLRMMESKKSYSLDELTFGQHMAEGHHEPDVYDHKLRASHQSAKKHEVSSGSGSERRASTRDLAPNANKIKLMMLHSMKAIAQENGHNGHVQQPSPGDSDKKRPGLEKEGSIEVIPIQMQTIDPNRKDVLGQIMQERITLEMQKANLDPSKVNVSEVPQLIQRALAHERQAERYRISDFEGPPWVKSRTPHPPVPSPLTINEDGRYEVHPAGLSLRFDHYHQVVAIETIPERRHTIGTSQLSGMIPEKPRLPNYLPLPRKCRSPNSHLHPGRYGEKIWRSRSTSPKNEVFVPCSIEIGAYSPDLPIDFGKRNSERERAEFGKSRRQTEPDVRRPNREMFFAPRLSLQVQPMPQPPDAPQSPPQKRRGPKLNLRMKSFSVDTPDAPKMTTIDQSSKSKSGSFSKMQGHSCFSNDSPGQSQRESRESSPAQRNKDVQRISSHHSSPSLSPVRDSQAPVDSPPRPRRKKLNMRMKSFSVDTPEPPRPITTIDENSKKKSSSFTNASSCFGDKIYSAWPQSRFKHPSPTSPSGNTFVPTQRRSKFSLGSCSVDKEDGYDSHSPRSNHSISPHSGNSPKSQRKQTYSSYYAVLYNFKAKERGDLELRAGDRVYTIDSSDPDWWKGKSGGKIGYFPSSYVSRILPGEKVLQVISGVEISGETSGIKLLKDQIVIGEGDKDTEGMVMIRTSDNVSVPCPRKYLGDV